MSQSTLAKHVDSSPNQLYKFVYAIFVYQFSDAYNEYNYNFNFIKVSERLSNIFLQYIEEYNQ